ncbi:MAG: glycerophosphodiester phosphodiesterase [Pseudomonadota bacterium]
MILPPIIGHRGAAGLAPENTLASFQAAAALGCRMVEFDVRLSADRVPVVFHDDTLDRRTSGRGPVAGHTLEQLRALDAGGGEVIPTLAEVLLLCRSLGLAANMEIKPDRGAERATALAALAESLGLWPAECPPPLVSSFSEEALAAAREAAPGWPRGLLLGRLPPDWRARAEALGCASIHCSERELTSDAVRAVTVAGYPLLAYTVNDRARAESLWRMGVVSVFTDRPDQLS